MHWTDPGAESGRLSPNRPLTWRVSLIFASIGWYRLRSGEDLGVRNARPISSSCARFTRLLMIFSSIRFRTQRTFDRFFLFFHQIRYLDTIVIDIIRICLKRRLRKRGRLKKRKYDWRNVAKIHRIIWWIFAVNFYTDGTQNIYGSCNACLPVDNWMRLMLTNNCIYNSYSYSYFRLNPLWRIPF